MTSTQKQAWFNLAVVGLTVVTFAALVPMVGVQRAQAAFAWLALMAFGIFFFRKRPGQVVIDERDAQIRGRSLMIAYAVFWVAFVFASVLLPLAIYGERGAVPVTVVQASVWVAWILVTGIESVATLVQYARGGSDVA